MSELRAANSPPPESLLVALALGAFPVGFDHEYREFGAPEHPRGGAAEQVPVEAGSSERRSVV